MEEEGSSTSMLYEMLDNMLVLAISCLLAGVVALWSAPTWSAALCRADWSVLRCACGRWSTTKTRTYAKKGPEKQSKKMGTEGTCRAVLIKGLFGPKLTFFRTFFLFPSFIFFATIRMLNVRYLSLRWNSKVGNYFLFFLLFPFFLKKKRKSGKRLFDKSGP